MRRRIEPELLDELPPEDPLAKGSRRDLQRINWLMGNAGLLGAAVMKGLREPPGSIVELGAGDGTLMLAVARRLAKHWQGPVRVELLDRAPVVEAATLEGFARLGWQAEVVRCDLRDWLREEGNCDLILANLFLHHFKEPELRQFFAAFARKARAFASCDPRRWAPALVTTHLLWAIGCNRVTRHDAVVSVRAGFRDAELSALWPAESGFVLSEWPASHASHIFLARREG